MTARRARGVSPGIRALLAIGAVAVVAALSAAVEPARACSCIPPDPWVFLKQSDGAFVGRLTSRDDIGEGRARLTFSVERAVKGQIGASVDVLTANNGAACGIEASDGQRIGLFLSREDGRWTGTLCWQVAPEDLLAAAVLPAPNGRGPVAMFVGGHFGPARTLALDARGRTLAYGLGPGLAEKYSVCPGDRRVAELSTTKPAGFASYTLTIRELPTLRIVRQQILPSKQWIRDPFRCMNASGEQLVLYMSSVDRSKPDRLIRIRGRHSTTIWHGSASYASFSDHHAFVQAPGPRGVSILAVSLRTGTAEKLGVVPIHGVFQLVANSAGTRLAGNALEDGSQDSRLLVIDLTRRPIAVRTVADPTDFGHVLWLHADRFAYFGNRYSGGTSHIYVYDAALRLRARVPGWQPGDQPALVGSTAFGVSSSGRVLVTATLPSGRLRIVRQLPGTPAVIAAATR